MTRKEAQELATVLHQRRRYILAHDVPNMQAAALACFDAVATDLYVHYVRHHLVSIPPENWRDAWHDGRPLFVSHPREKEQP